MSREDEIEARLAKRTPGRWVKGGPSRWCNLDHYPHGQGQCDYQIWAWNLRLKEISTAEGANVLMGNDSGLHVSSGDADLIVNAPSDLEYLLAENARLREELAQADDDLSDPSAYWSRITSEAQAKKSDDMPQPEPCACHGQPWCEDDK